MTTASPFDTHPDALPDALIAEGLNALRARDMARAANALRSASSILPVGRMPWPALAQAELGLGNHVAAEAALDNQLSLAPRDVGALLAKGQLRQRARDDRAAVSFYSTGLAQAAVSGLPRGLEGLAAAAQAFIGSANAAFRAHLEDIVGTGLSSAMNESMGLLKGERAIDLQQPSVLYYPGLAQRRFFDPADFPWLKPMLALLPEMHAELSALLESELPGSFAPYVTASTDRPAPNNPLLGDPSWGAHYFWKDGEIVEANAVRCPATMAALAQAPMPMIPGRAPNALWSRLRPGTHITPHFGLLNTRLICHLPIRTAPGCTLRVGSETRTWQDNIPLIFDDSMEHEARNDGPENRVVLLFEIWRPEIPDEDRAAITRLIAGIVGYDSAAG